jgi:hypothetical protein
VHLDFAVSLVGHYVDAAERQQVPIVPNIFILNQDARGGGRGPGLRSLFSFN